MGLTYAGQPLLLDWDDQIANYLSRFIPQAYHTLFCPTPPAFTNGEWTPKDHIRAHVGIPYANWTPPTGLKLNTLYWPSGASRWGYGLFLVDSLRLDAIKANIETTGTQSQTLQMSAIRWPQWSVEAEVAMFMLPPLQLPTTGPGHGDQLYLMTLVDQRYFWQWRDAGSLEIDEDDTWLQLLYQLQEQLDVTLNVDGIAGAYYQPNQIEFSRSFHNAAMLLDAVAWSIGKRVSVGLDGQVYLYGPDADSYRLTTNLESTDFTAGGKGSSWHNQLPTQIRVVFPRGEYVGGEHIPGDDGEVYALTYTTDDILLTIDPDDPPDIYSGPAMANGTTETYFTSFVADFTQYGEFVPTVPWNRDLCMFLAQRIATDVVNWRRQHSYDMAFPGLHTGLATVNGTTGENSIWSPTGFDDWIEVHFDVKTPVTRIRSMPGNWRASKLLQANPFVNASSSGTSSSSCSSTSTSGGSSSSSSCSSAGSSSSESPTSGEYKSTSVEIVSDVYCEDDEIVVCYRTLTFPVVVTIGAETCPGAGSSSSLSGESTSSTSSASSSSSLSESSASSISTSSTSSESSSSSSSSSEICKDVVTITKFGLDPVVPDVTGDYIEGASYNGKESFYLQAGGWFLWWDSDDGQWIISVTQGAKFGAWWEGLHPTPRGDYNPHGTAVGALIGDC